MARPTRARALAGGTRTNRLARIAVKTGEEKLLERSTPRARRVNEGRNTPRSQNGEEVSELLAGRKVRHVGLRLHVLEVNAHAKSSIEKVEGIHQQSGVHLARVPVEKTGNSTGIIDPVNGLTALKKIRHRRVHRRCRQDLALANLLLLMHEEIQNMNRNRRVRVVKPTTVGGRKPQNQASPHLVPTRHQTKQAKGLGDSSQARSLDRAYD